MLKCPSCKKAVILKGDLFRAVALMDAQLLEEMDESDAAEKATNFTFHTAEGLHSTWFSIANNGNIYKGKNDNTRHELQGHRRECRQQMNAEMAHLGRSTGNNGRAEPPHHKNRPAAPLTSAVRLGAGIGRARGDGKPSPQRWAEKPKAQGYA